MRIFRHGGGPGIRLVVRRELEEKDKHTKERNTHMREKSEGRKKEVGWIRKTM